MGCIKKFWDEEDRRRVWSCPQCEQTFRQRPSLVINTMLADLVEDLELAWDQEVFCARHNEVANIFCQTDQLCVCVMCAKNEHKSHHLVAAHVARAERQKELETRQQKIQQQINNKERDLEVLKIELDKTYQSADKAVQESNSIFEELVYLIQKMNSEVKREIGSNLEKEVVRVRKLQEKLQSELTELMLKEAELGKLIVYQDDGIFLKTFSSLAKVDVLQELPRVKTQPRCYFENVAGRISKLKDKILDILIERSTPETEIAIAPKSQTKPLSRGEFLQYACQVTLDCNTANAQLALSENDRRATLLREETVYPDHADRFLRWRQVLSRESLSGRCYFEVEWRKKRVTVALAYRNIPRCGTMTDVAFGFNNKSWALECNTSSSYKFIHNTVKTHVLGPWTSRIGVFLDSKEGYLAFYSVSDTLTLLHEVHTTFTRPLHAGLWFAGYQGAYAEFCGLGKEK